MPEYVLDASAILALLQSEQGADHVRERISRAVVSAVNLAEVGARLVDRGFSDVEVREVLVRIGVEVSPFDTDQAIASATLRATTHAQGLSLGERACLALAQSTGLPALTADRAWRDVDLGIVIELIRD